MTSRGALPPTTIVAAAQLNVLWTPGFSAFSSRQDYYNQVIDFLGTIAEDLLVLKIYHPGEMVSPTKRSSGWWKKVVAAIAILKGGRGLATSYLLQPRGRGQRRPRAPRRSAIGLGTATVKSEYDIDLKERGRWPREDLGCRAWAGQKLQRRRPGLPSTRATSTWRSNVSAEVLLPRVSARSRLGSTPLRADAGLSRKDNGSRPSSARPRPVSSCGGI